MSAMLLSCVLLATLTTLAALPTQSNVSADSTSTSQAAAAATHAKQAATREIYTDKAAHSELESKHSKHSKLSKEAELKLLQQKIAVGRAEAQKVLARMATRKADLRGLADNATQLDRLTQKIETHVMPALSSSRRTQLQQYHAEIVHQLRTLNASEQGAKETANRLQHAAEQDADLLRDADKKQVSELHREFLKMRRSDQDLSKAMEKQAQKAVRSMGSATKLELAEQRAHRAERDYDRDEDSLQQERDRLFDQIGDMRDDLDDVVETVYDNVRERVEARSKALEERSDSEQHALRKHLRDAREASDLASTSMQAGPSSDSTDTICGALVVAGTVGSLAIFAMRRRAEQLTITQRELFA